MDELTPEIIDTVLVACHANAAEIGEALSRALDRQIAVTVGDHGILDSAAVAAELGEPGLAIVLAVGSSAALILLPEKTGLLPPWCAEPDATGQSKLTTLAQELGLTVLPEQLTAEDFKAAFVKNLAGAMGRGGVREGAGSVRLKLAGGGRSGTATIVWPASKPSAVLGAAKPAVEPKSEPAKKSAPPAKSPSAKSSPAPAKAASPGNSARKPRRVVGVSDLPTYTRSLLRVKVPVVVTLAEKRQPLGRIMELGPGSIIQFDKSCEEMLDMDVGECRVATGEAVKVGDKFGLRITSVVLPGERFKPLAKQK